MSKGELPPTAKSTTEDESAKTVADRRGTAAGPALPIVSEDRYQIGKEIGHGGLGRVIEARDPRLDRTVALKELVDQDPDARGRFMREAVITAQLEHPSIVPIHEAGRWPTGEPFYVMKRVSGRTLDVAANAAKTLAERTALLPNIIAVAEAVGYAHSQGVIHRDLKPQNVLVGAFGETVVIDWGLAKRLDAADEAPSGREPYQQSPAEMTEIGTVMGTPSYMPPEQAAGERVDERADVYALGAMTYQVLSGRPPYAGRSSREVLDTVVTRPPRPLAEVAPELPHDLLAIVNKAMAREPAGRYPTAVELAQDLKRYVAGQLVASHQYSMAELVRRWLRRWRAPIAVAAVAFVLLIVLGVVGVRRIISERTRAEAERTRAEAERALAEQRSGDVEDLMGFMLFEMRDRLMAIGRVDLLAPVTRKAAAYYADTRADETDIVRHHRAVALLNIGDVTRTQGDLLGALADYAAARAVIEDLAARQPDSDEAQLDLVNVHKRIGQVLMAQGKTVDALAEFQREIELLEHNAVVEPANQVWRLTLIDAFVDAGSSFISQARVGEGIAFYQKAVAAGDEALARYGYTQKTVHAVVAARLAAGGAMAGHGRLDEGVAELRDGLHLMTDHAVEVTDLASWKRDIYFTYLNLGDGLAAMGVIDGALGVLAAGEVFLVELTVLDPAATDVLRDLGRVHLRTGRILADRGDLPAAEHATKAGLAIYERLAANDPQNGEWHRYVFDARIQLGTIYQGRGAAMPALEVYEQMLVGAEQRHAMEPTNGEWEANLVQAHIRCGEAHQALKQPAEAIAEFRKAVEVDEHRLAIDPNDADAKRSLLSSSNTLANAMSASDAAGAVEVYQHAIARAAELRSIDPDGRDNWLILEVLHGGLADAYGKLKKWDDALRESRAALEAAVTLVEMDPTNVDWQDDLIALRMQLADVLRMKGDRTAARKEMETALGLARRAVGLDAANTRRPKVVRECEEWLRKY
jgi:tetratricopeptide (TPR) repeat protein